PRMLLASAMLPLISCTPTSLWHLIAAATIPCTSVKLEILTCLTIITFPPLFPYGAVRPMPHAITSRKGHYTIRVAGQKRYYPAPSQIPRFVQCTQIRDGNFGASNKKYIPVVFVNFCILEYRSADTG